MLIFAQMFLGLWLGIVGTPANVDDVGSRGEHSSSSGYDWDNAGGYDWDNARGKGYDWDNQTAPE